jgi:hypothetical protein
MVEMGHQRHMPAAVHHPPEQVEQRPGIRLDIEALRLRKVPHLRNIAEVAEGVRLVAAGRSAGSEACAA